MELDASLPWLALALTPGLASRLSGRLLEEFGSPEEVFRAPLPRLERCKLPAAVAQAVFKKQAFKRAEKEGRLLELIESLLGEEDAKKVLEMAKDAEGLCKLAEASRPLACQIAEALSLRADKYDRLFKERFAPQLDANPVAAMLGTDYEHASGEESTAHCRLVLLKTALDVLRRGKSALNDHPDPYGDGPFAYAEIDGGFELGSALVYGNRQIRMRFGVPGASVLVPVKAL